MLFDDDLFSQLNETAAAGSTVVNGSVDGSQQPIQLP
jgi:hypothetical protein